MTNDEPSRIHPETGERLTRQVRPMTTTYGGHSVTFEQPGWYPEGDGDAVLDYADCKIADDFFVQLRALADLADAGCTIDITNLSRDDLKRVLFALRLDNQPIEQ